MVWLMALSRWVAGLVQCITSGDNFKIWSFGWVGLMFFCSGGCDATSPPFVEVGPTYVFVAASDAEQSVGERRSQVFGSRSGTSPCGTVQAATATLLYLDCDIAFPSPALAKAGDGAVHGEQPLWPDHAFEIAGTASLHRLVQLIAAAEDRAPEGREHEAVEKPLVSWFMIPDVVSGIGKATRC